jgi:D-sedoheptulose 7-phosphate isomerase
MSQIESIENSLRAHLASLGRLGEAAPVIDRIVSLIAESLNAGGKVLTCGNGGSAAEALHLAEEMIGRFAKKRRPLGALCLSADPTALTCIANDYGFEQVFARQVEGLAHKGDVLVALSTSGKSANILRALEAARKISVRTVGLLGPPGSPAEKLCDIAFTAQATHNAHTQEMHLMAIHLILEQLDELA